jgi:hypothetical protein
MRGLLVLLVAFCGSVQAQTQAQCENGQCFRAPVREAFIAAREIQPVRSAVAGVAQSVRSYGSSGSAGTNYGSNGSAPLAAPSYGSTGSSVKSYGSSGSAVSYGSSGSSLKPRSRLLSGAKGFAQQLASAGGLAHDANYSGRENVFYSSSATLPRLQARLAWLASPGHRANLPLVGLGVARGPSGVYVVGRRR